MMPSHQCKLHKPPSAQAVDGQGVQSRCIWSFSQAEPTRSSSSMRRSDQPCSTRSEEHTSELQSRENLVCRRLLEKKKMMREAGIVAFSGTVSNHWSRKSAALIVLSCTKDCFSPRGSFFFNDTATTEIYTLSLHDALPI